MQCSQLQCAVRVQPPLQTAAAAETIEAVVAFTAPAVAAAVALAFVATTAAAVQSADPSANLASECTHHPQMICM
jgi:hypothetical protein